jgi:dTDP-4-amino-4,6-dideoxygalactose transaminase
MNDTVRLYRAFATELNAAMIATIADGRWLNGPRTAAFTEAFAGYLGATYCLAVANGTDALELALRALIADRRTEGREVITVANAGGYATTACRQVGLIPVYADIVPETQLIDPESVVSALGGNTAAVVATHLYGGVVDIPGLRQAMDEAGFSRVPIIEDCAQAHGARLGDRLVGTFGDIAAFSFYPTKNLGAVGDAGAIVTSDESLFEAVRQLNQYGWSRKYEVTRAGGRNSRMDEIQATVLATLLPHLDTLNARRLAILGDYAEANPALAFLRPATGTVAHLAVALCPSRDSFRQHMRERGIATDIHYPILDCDQTGWAGLAQRTAPGGIPMSRRSVGQIVTAPCFPFMTEPEVERVTEAIAAWRPS